jgi:hypothetical protein
MKNIFETILEGIEWVVLSKWYKGGDMGDGILVSLISGAIFMSAAIWLVIYCFYTLLCIFFNCA